MIPKKDLDAWAQKHHDILFSTETHLNRGKRILGETADTLAAFNLLFQKYAEIPKADIEQMIGLAQKMSALRDEMIEYTDDWAGDLRAMADLMTGMVGLSRAIKTKEQKKT